MADSYTTVATTQRLTTCNGRLRRSLAAVAGVVPLIRAPYCTVLTLSRRISCCSCWWLQHTIKTSTKPPTKRGCSRSHHWFFLAKCEEVCCQPIRMPIYCMWLRSPTSFANIRSDFLYTSCPYFECSRIIAQRESDDCARQSYIYVNHITVSQLKADHL